MRKTKLLSALVIGGLAGAMTLSATTNQANATSHIHINTTGGGEGSDSHWYHTSAVSSGGDLDVSGPSRTFTKWIGDDIEDNVILEGGNLEIRHTDSNGTINATNGSLNISTGTLHLNSSSSIADTVNLAVSGTLDMQGGAVYIGGSGDSWNGIISHSGGDLTISGVTKNGRFTQSGGTANIYQDLTLTSSASDSVSGGTLKIGDGGSNNGALTTNINLGASVTKNIQENGNLAVNGGATVLDGGDTWKGAVSNTGGTVTFDGVTKNGTFTHSGGTTNVYQNMTLASTDVVGTAGVLNVGNGTDKNVTLTTNTNLGGEIVKYINTGSTLAVNAGNTLLDNDDHWNGTLSNTGGNITLEGVTKNGKFTQSSGTTKIYQNLTLNSNADPALADSVTGGILEIGNGTTKNGTLTTNINLGASVTKNIQANGNLAVNGGATVLDGGDTWNGAVSNTGGTVTFDGVTKNGTFTQTSGNGMTNVYQNLTLSSPDSVTVGTLKIGDGGSNNGALTTNIDLGASVTKDIQANGSLTVNNGTTVIDSGDTWKGALSMTNGTTNITGRNDETSTANTGTYTQTAGTLKIDGDGSLQLNSGSSITSTSPATSYVVLGSTGPTSDPSDDTYGSLIFNNGITTNAAVVTTVGTANNVLTVQGVNNIDPENPVYTTLTLKDTSNIAHGTVNVGDTASNKNKLILTDTSAIAKEVALNVKADAQLDLQNNSTVTIDSDTDTWAGTIYSAATESNTTLTVLGDLNKTGKLLFDNGNLVIGDNDTGVSDVLNLNNTNDRIQEAAVVTINKDGKLNQSNGTVTLNGSGTGVDTWDGEIALSGSSLTLKNRPSDTTDTSTEHNKTYVQTGGTLTLDNSNLSLHDTTKSQIKDGTTTYSTVNLNNGSRLTLDNGTTLANAAVVISDTNANNSITVGGDNGAKLTLKAGDTIPTNSNINANTAVTIKANGELTTYGDSIKGDGSQDIINDGTFNLSNNGTTSDGILARVIDNAAGDGSTGTVNLTGITQSTSADTLAGTIAATINQANVTVGDGSGAAASDTSVFTMGADVTANTLLTVKQDAKIVNAKVSDTATNIVAQAIAVEAGGKITGKPNATTPTVMDYGNITVRNGGSNAGTIEQNNVTLNVVAAAIPEKLDNTGTLTANGTFTNNIEITDSAVTGKLNIKGGGVSSNIIKQNEVTVSGATAFNNNAKLTATKSLTNSGTINNTSDIDVKNATPATTPANLKNTGVINNTATTVGTTTTPATITADTLTNHDGTTNGTINLTNSKIAIVYQADDIKGIINTLGTSASTDVSELSIKGTNPNFAGALNVGNVADTSIKSALTLTSGNVVEDAIVKIATGNVMNVNGADSSLILDDGSVSGTADVYAGDLNLSKGSVEMKNLTLTTGDVSTTDPAYTGTKPYLNVDGGSLTLTKTTLSMVDSKLINNTSGTTDLTVDSRSVFNSLSNAFAVENLTTSGLINGINGGYENYAVASDFTVGNGVNDNEADFTTDLYARCDINNNIKYDTYGSDSATIQAANGTDAVLNVSDWTLNGDIYGWDAPIDRSYKIDKLFKGTVAAGQTIDFTSTDKEVLTPIGWYGLHSAGNGNYTFDLNRFNPGVFRGQVSKVAQYQNQLMIDDILFSHTMLDQGFKGNDYIASNPNRIAAAGDIFPPYQYSRKDGGLWVKMYGTFENLQMNVGKIGNNAYGTIIGADLGLKELKHGWQFMPTAYIGYNGAHQYWKGFGAYQNGGQAGLMGTWYKNNFIIGALAYGGVYNNNMDTPRGNDDSLGYFAGGAVKTAYNWRFAKNWSLQPNLLVAYNFFGQENWHSDFGQMGMMSGMLHGVNIAPGVNLIWEKETFSIYGTLQYMYNINQSAGGRAGHVDLPNVHMDRGYIQYGLGFNKRFGDRFNGFLQAVIRNVGRTGIGLQAGFQWQLGKGGSGEINGKTPELKKSEIILHNQKIQ